MLWLLTIHAEVECPYVGSGKEVCYSVVMTAGGRREGRDIKWEMHPPLVGWEMYFNTATVVVCPDLAVLDIRSRGQIPHTHREYTWVCFARNSTLDSNSTIIKIENKVKILPKTNILPRWFYRWYFLNQTSNTQILRILCKFFQRIQTKIRSNFMNVKDATLR